MVKGIYNSSRTVGIFTEEAFRESFDEKWVEVDYSELMREMERDRIHFPNGTVVGEPFLWAIDILEGLGWSIDDREVKLLVSEKDKPVAIKFPTGVLVVAPIEVNK